MAKLRSAPRLDEIGEAGQDYLKALYLLSADAGSHHETEGAGRPHVRTNDLADRLGVSAPSASRMLARLDRLGLVEHEHYRGAALTPEGERLALEIVRRHRLIEAYLHEKLGYDLEEVHAEAERLEHHISEALEARIYEALGRPVVDPHGDIIPTSDGYLPEQSETGGPRTPLADASELGWVVVVSVPSSDAEKLRYLREIGVVPGSVIRVVEKYPYGGGVLVSRASGAGEQVVGNNLAAQITVSAADPPGNEYTPLQGGRQ